MRTPDTNEPLRSGRLFGRERWMVYHPDADTRAPVFKTRKEARENCTRWNRSSCTGHIVIDLEKRPNIQDQTRPATGSNYEKQD